MTPEARGRVPRTLAFITVKRNTPVAGRSYGHWWIELDDGESYGWWPARLPLRVRDLWRGVPGVLNGVGVTEDGTPTRDPNHGVPGDYEFHPLLILDRSDDDVRGGVREFVHGFRGEWRWSIHPTMNCRLFQLALFDAVGLVDGYGNYHTRGAGCPMLAPMRRVLAMTTGRRRWPRNLPAPLTPATAALHGGCSVQEPVFSRDADDHTRSHEADAVRPRASDLPTAVQSGDRIALPR